jgi:hypothetical protein
MYTNAFVHQSSNPLRALFGAGSAWPGLLAASLLAAFIVLLIFKLTSDQVEVRRRRNRVLARLLEIALFKDDVIESAGAFKRVVTAALQYALVMAKPILISACFMAPVMALLSAVYEHRPLKPGETALLAAHFAPAVPVMNQNLSLHSSSNVIIETPPVRIPARNEVSWRIRAVEAGPGWVELKINEVIFRKVVSIGYGAAPVMADGMRSVLWGIPGCQPVWAEPAGVILHRMAVCYPDRTMAILGLRLSWLPVFLMLTMAFGLVLKKFMGVRMSQGVN